MGNANLTLNTPQYSYRDNPDKVTNSHGKEMIKICKAFKFVFVNNLSKGDLKFDGDFTFHKGDRRSQNDILITNNTGLSNIKSFNIHSNIHWNPSDHCPISTNILFCIFHENFRSKASSDILTTAGEPSVTRERKINPILVDWQMYKQLTFANFNSLVTDLNSVILDPCLSNIDRTVKNINLTLTAAANTSINSDSRNNDVVSPLDFDEHVITLATIESSVKDEQINMWKQILNSNDSKCLWNRIDWNGSSLNSVNVYPEIDELVNHFKEKGQSSDNSTLLCEVTENNYVEELDNFKESFGVKIGTALHKK